MIPGITEATSTPLPPTPTDCLQPTLVKAETASNLRRLIPMISEAEMTSPGGAENDILLSEHVHSALIHTGGPDVMLPVIPDMITIVPLDTLNTFAVTLVVFGSEGGSMMGMLGLGLCGPHIGMILFRGTWAAAPSHLGM